MSLFVATLAFDTEELLNLAKIGTIVASAAAGIAGSIVLLTSRREAGDQAS